MHKYMAVTRRSNTQTTQLITLWRGVSRGILSRFDLSKNESLHPSNLGACVTSCFLRGAGTGAREFNAQTGICVRFPAGRMRPLPELNLGRRVLARRSGSLDGPMSLLCLFCLAATPAMSTCVQPDVPYCSTRPDRFASNNEMGECRVQMEAYRLEAENYASCRHVELLDAIRSLTTHVKNDLNTVENEFSEAVDTFNRRASSQD